MGHLTAPTAGETGWNLNLDSKWKGPTPQVLKDLESHGMDNLENAKNARDGVLFEPLAPSPGR